MLRALLNPFPIYGTGFKTDFSELSPFLIQREKEKQNTSFEGDWRNKLDLNQSLPNIKSYLALGFPYPVFYPKIRNGSVSSYSVITDYHFVLIQKLKRIQTSLETIYPGEKFKILVDSGKAFEKQLGASAKIGFIGKNTLLIHPVYGSYFFIGIILSTAEFPKIYSHSEMNFSCGACSICVRSCPSEALRDYVLNAGQCCSYLSQVNNGENDFPYIWGCDICQMACPYNLNRKKEAWADFQYLFDSRFLKPDLSSEEFRSLAKKLPMGFRGYESWMKKMGKINEIVQKMS